MARRRPKLSFITAIQITALQASPRNRRGIEDDSPSIRTTEACEDSLLEERSLHEGEPMDFSDVNRAELWIHWHGTLEDGVVLYWMNRLGQYVMGRLAETLHFRHDIHNILDWA